MRRLRVEDKKILENAKTEATNHCLNELEMRAELLDIKGKTNEAKHGTYTQILSLVKSPFIFIQKYILFS